MPSLSEQLQEARSQAEVCLYSGGRVLEVRAAVTVMAHLPLPPCSKYHHVSAETVVIENSFGSNRKETLASLQRLSTALNILEKYGCNLTNPNRPKYWRTVKHNNPVFRATVDAIQGGRAVLCLYGYSNQKPDGLSFPDDVTDPDVGKVAAVTLEVMSLRMELEMLIKETHPHPEFYERIIPTLRHKMCSTRQQYLDLQYSAVPSQDHCIEHYACSVIFPLSTSAGDDLRLTTDCGARIRLTAPLTFIQTELRQKQHAKLATATRD